jgi:hypothetical protein
MFPSLVGDLGISFEHKAADLKISFVDLSVVSDSNFCFRDASRGEPVVRGSSTRSGSSLMASSFASSESGS